MKSHTVPRKLLEQFAKYNERTKSLRLWRYEKGRLPYPNASPRTATRIDGAYSHPDIRAKEAELEKRLAKEFEEPVNQFLFQIIDPAFEATDERRRSLTKYVTLLFNRSDARRKATRHLQMVTIQAINSFIDNDRQVQTVAAKWSIDLLLSGNIQGAIVSPDEVRRAARALLQNYDTEHNRQASYAESIERAMSYFDDKLYSGMWRFLKATASEPFIISDAPVVTWERLEKPGQFAYGMGFHRSNVEVFLPLSPLVCLHILPNVERTKPMHEPTTREVNYAQAAFAGRFCFANIQSDEIDAIMQRNYGKAKLGETAFTVWHRNYESSVYDLLMNNGRWVEPPRL
jgi:hypothetical protein